MKMNPLKQLEALGQSVWLDFIKRDLIRSGELKKLIEEDSLSGMTSNPVLFENAIRESQQYDETIKQVVEQGKTVNEIYEVLAKQDVQEAADVFSETYKKTHGEDGYVSLEVNPHLAYDTDATIEEARRLWQHLNKPNVLIKVPATKPGLPAISQLISEGINVNVTILFSLSRYEDVANAYIDGLEARAAAGKPLDHIASVASFFLSRIDVLVDPLLEKIMAEENDKAELAKKMHGEVAIASAKMAYQLHQRIFNTNRFTELAKSGAKAQRLLWASTGTKNPSYSKIKYIEALICPKTIDTMPYDTLQVYREQGKPELRFNQHLEQARWIMNNLPQLGIDMTKVTDQLEQEGVDKFNHAFDGLLQTLKKKTSAVKKAA